MDKGGVKDTTLAINYRCGDICNTSNNKLLDTQTRML